MGREVRMVPKDWEHPKYQDGEKKGRYIPMYRWDFESLDKEWMEGWEAWQGGYHDGKRIPKEDRVYTYTEYAGERPSPDNYMPNWSKEERTHLMMYEDTSEGTPISPAFGTPGELARWLADNGASSFGRDTATYEQWLAMCKSGWAPSAVIHGGKFMSGVEAATNLE